MGKTAPPNGLVTRFQRMVRPTLPAVSVAPITATFCGAKNTSRGELRCGRALREALLGLMACIFFDVRPGVKRSQIEPVDDVLPVESVLARYGLDVAVVARAAETH